jgi:two-component system, NarL family, sensor histidine kinase DesK
MAGMNVFTDPRVLAWRDRLVPADSGMGWGAFASLCYVTFPFLPLLIPRIATPQWLQPTVLVMLVFLPLYFRAFWARPRELALLLLLLLALALLLVRDNPFANTLVIYACAFAPRLGRLRLSVSFAFALVAVFSIAAGLSRGGALTAAITWLVGTACFVGAYFMGENHRKQVALRLSHDEVRRLAALAERERIGRDLHDLLGHTLSLIALKAELANRLWERDAAAARKEIREVENVARQALAQVRRAVTGIRSAGLAAEVASARLLLESAGTGFRYELEPLSLPAELETCLALVVREAVTNIQRHARASRASVKLRREGEDVLLDVQDDGCGADIVPGNGLAGMRERLAALGAELRVDAGAGRGTRLSVRVPRALADAAPQPLPLH